MGGVVGDIARGVTDTFAPGVRQTVMPKDQYSNKKFNPTGALIGAGSGSALMGPSGAVIGGVFGHEQSMGEDGGESPPPAPGIDPNLQRLKDQQIKYAKDFRAGMPEMQRKMGEDLKTQSNRAMSQGQQNVKQNYASRGLLHSGMRQGAQAQVRGQAQAGLASGLTGINADLENAANTLDTQAIQTGVGIQQQQQAIQNQIYSQAQAKIAAQNQMTGSMIGTGLLAGTLAL